MAFRINKSCFSHLIQIKENQFFWKKALFNEASDSIFLPERVPGCDFSQR